MAVLLFHSAIKKPTDPNVNWLPAPEGNFYLLFRMYQPQDAVMNNEWKLPQVTKSQ
ncbi:TPA: DUF1214 domain-containing protein [Salmonella enterica subsp. enterica serovar Warragul]|uniref:DUF1214 domain-containing protein n=1 Tax=Buttiauxella TaxID=82976 RepID=UPI001FB907D7|nr:DUF1214 domain-containing protein [Buttiauxella sp. BIGb0552]